MCKSSTEIFGDLLAWSASTDPGQILVWNWKTGDMLLHLTPYADLSCFKFLDDSHFLVLFDKDLRIYELHQPTSESRPITIADCPCVLRLPAFDPGAAYLLSKMLHMHSSSSPSDAAPLFDHDPELRIVCVTLRVRYISDEDLGDNQVDNIVFLIPVATLLSQFQRVHNATSADTSAPREVPWEDWGPAGSRVFVTGFWDMAVSGTKLVAAPWIGWDASTSDRHLRHRLIVLDTNPMAGYDLARRPRFPEDPAEPDSEGGYITTRRAFQGPVRS